MRYSTNYRATVQNLNDPLISKLKLLTKILNAKQKVDELEGKVKFWYWGKTKHAKRFRFVIRGRLGKNNPHAHLYRYGGPLYRHCAQDIRLEHSQRYDLYIQDYMQPLKG